MESCCLSLWRISAELVDRDELVCKTAGLTVHAALVGSFTTIIGGAALIVAATVVMALWVRFVMFGDGQRELRRIERLWGPVRMTDDVDDDRRLGDGEEER